MDASQDADRLRRKSTRARTIAIVLMFLMALFWSLSSFFIWAFLAAASYCWFLAWYYYQQSLPPDEVSAGRASPDYPPTASTLSRTNLPKALIPVVIGLVVTIALARIIFTSGSDDHNQAENTENASNDETVNSDDVDALNTKGNEFFDKSNYDSAMVYYNKVLDIDPTNQYGQYNRALVFYSQKDYYKPIPILRKCLAEHPDYNEAYWLLGVVYYDRNTMDSAVIALNRGYDKGFRNAHFLRLLASTYENKDNSKAVKYYKEAVGQDSTIADSYDKLATLDPDHATQYVEMKKRLAAPN